VSATLTREARLTHAGVTTTVRLTKRITLSRRRSEITVVYTLQNLGATPLTVHLASEWNLALKDPHYNRVGAIPSARRLTVTDSHQDVSVAMAASTPAAVWYFPVETVSDSERGLERTYQQMNLTWVWTVTAAPRRPWRATLTSTVRAGGVHAAA